MPELRPIHMGVVAFRRACSLIFFSFLSGPPDQCREALSFQTIPRKRIPHELRQLGDFLFYVRADSTVMPHVRVCELKIGNVEKLLRRIARQSQRAGIAH